MAIVSVRIGKVAAQCEELSNPKELKLQMPIFFCKLGIFLVSIFGLDDGKTTIWYSVSCSGKRE